MSLLKETEAKSKRPMSHPVMLTRWPVRDEGIGTSVKDGWHFGIGFGLALTLALPLILSVGACFT